MEEYFFIAVSTRENLEICKRHAYAGFPDTINGVWAYLDIKIGDFVTFLYGARAHNLYQVVKKEAIVNAENLPPWKPIHFRESGKTCGFPFRLHLRQCREFVEPLARPEFMYVAENLLQRGGYWKTHFQADQTTLQNVSHLGEIFSGGAEPLEMPAYETFVPEFVRGRKTGSAHVYPFREVILQSVLRQHLLNPDVLGNLLSGLGLEGYDASEFEVLGEKALPEGYVDIIIKEAKPKGMVRQIVVEVKLGSASEKDVEQLRRYMNEIGEECLAGVLVAERVPRKLKAWDRKIHLATWSFDGADLRIPQSFEKLLSNFRLIL